MSKTTDISDSLLESLEERIERHEGMRLEPYHDTRELLTIGIGRCLDTHPFSPAEIAHIGHDGRTKPITEDQALWLLDRDIDACEKTLQHSFPWALSLTPIRQEVIIEMLFQLGLSRLLQFKKTLQLMKDGDSEGAAAEMLDSDWHKQTPARAEELSALYQHG